MTAQGTRRVWASPAEVAEWLQLGAGGLKKLQRMRAADKRSAANGDPVEGIRYIEVGRDIRYAWADVHAWCREQASRG